METSDVVWALSQAFTNMSYPLTKEKIYSWVKYDCGKRELDRALKELTEEGYIIKMGKHYEPSPRFKGEIAVRHLEDIESREEVD